MLALLLFVVFGLGFAYFATQNISTVTIHFGTTTLDGVPLYIVVLAALAIGLLIASIFYVVKSFSMHMATSKLSRELSDIKKENVELTRENHKLELENTKLKAKNGDDKEVDEDSI